MRDPSIRVAKLRRMAGRLPVRTGDSPAGLGLTSFAVDYRRLQELDELIDDYGVADDQKAEWPNNMLSKRTVIFENGAFARTRYKPRFDVDQEELALCKRVSMAAKAIVGDKYLGLGDASDHPFVPFFVAANTFDPRPTVIDSDFIKDRFAQTLFPPFTIKVEPLSKDADWWKEVEGWCAKILNSGHRVRDMDLAIWNQMHTFIVRHPEFVRTAFVSVGNWKERHLGNEASWPKGTVIAPCVMPRMIVGLTARGSLCGLLSWGVCK